MPKFVIEREMPGAGDMSNEERQGGARLSNEVIDKMGAQIEWVHSYITPDKIYCVYIAPDAESVREHARLGGFPADQVAEVKTIIDPTTAEA